MSIKIDTLEAVPVLNQDSFPDLPSVPDDSIVYPISSVWNSSRKECVAGIIITASAHTGVWQAVSKESFFSLLEKTIFKIFGQVVVNALWALAEDELIKVVQVGDMQYIVPTPEFAKIALANNDLALM